MDAQAFGFLAVVIMMLVAVGFFAYRSTKENQARRLRQADAWVEAANRLGCSIVAADGVAITGDVDRSTIRVDRHWVNEGKTRVEYTRITVSGPDIPPHYTLDLLKEGALSAIAKKLGAQDVIVGDRVFDDAFVVKTNAPELTRRMLHRPLTEWLLPLVDVELSMKNGLAVAYLPGIVEEPALLVSLIRTIVLLAEAPHRVLAGWEKLAESLGGTLVSREAWDTKSELPPIAIEPRGVPLRLEPGPDGDVHLIPTDPARLRVDPRALTEAGLRVEPDQKQLRVRVATETAAIEEAAEALTASAEALPYRG